jgi:hypothetical protein
MRRGGKNNDYWRFAKISGKPSRNTKVIPFSGRHFEAGGG